MDYYKCELCDKTHEGNYRGRYCQKCTAKVQENVKKMDKLQSAYGERLPEYVNMMLGKKLESLTKWLIVLTIILAVLAVVQILLLIR